MAKIYPLSEGQFTVGHDKQFIRFNEEKEELTARSIGSLHVDVQPFVVITDRDILLLDTGLGFANEDNLLQIHQNLFDKGIAPETVTKVLLSHLHKDHAGGIVFKDEDGIIKPTFCNAVYYIYRKEAEYALKTGLPSYVPEEIEALLRSNQVKWLDAEEGYIDNYIHYSHSGAHCPAHIVFLIDDGFDKVFYGGDEAPQLKQMLIRYIAKYDFDGKKAMQLREQYAERGKRDGWQFLFYHDYKTPVSKIN